MKKLVRTLKKLEPGEFRRLDGYLCHPNRAVHSATLQLFAYLQPRFPEFQNVGFEDYARRFHQGNLEKTEFRLRCSYLLGYVYRFLARKEMENDPQRTEQALIEVLIRRDEYGEADRRTKAALNHLASKAVLESNNYYHEARLRESMLDLSFSQDMQQGHHGIEEYFETLDHLHVGLTLKYLLPALTLHRLFGRPFPEERWEYCRRQMDKWGDQVPVLARISYHLLELFRGGLQHNYAKVVRLVEGYASRMSVTERMNVYGYMQNYLTQRQSKGDPGALRQLFSLYQRMYREELVFGRGDFSEHIVRNIVITSCRLGELEWTRDFLEGERPQIVESAGENVYAYILAFYHFYAGAYSEALQELQRVQFTGSLYRTGHQTLLLRIYFELRDIESIEAVAATFRRYLNRARQMSDRKKDLNRRFISVVQLMARSRDDGLTAYRRKRIEEYLSSEGGITDRTWLAEKWGEVMQGV